MKPGLEVAERFAAIVTRRCTWPLAYLSFTVGETAVLTATFQKGGEDNPDDGEQDGFRSTLAIDPAPNESDGFDIDVFEDGSTDLAARFLRAARELGIDFASRILERDVDRTG